MSRKDEILRNAEKMKRQEREESKRRAKERVYDGRGMDSEGMPLGCWIVIALVLLAAYLLLKGVLH